MTINGFCKYIMIMDSHAALQFYKGWRVRVFNMNIKRGFVDFSMRDFNTFKNSCFSDEDWIIG